jgi:HEAT repeat protein
MPDKVAHRLGIFGRTRSEEKNGSWTVSSRRADIAATDAALINTILTALQEPNTIVRRDAIAVLDNEDTAQLLRNLQSKTADPEVAVSALIPTLRDPDTTVRGYAVQTLGSIRSKTAIPALTSTPLKDSDATVRGYTAQALGNIRSKTAVPALTSALQDTDVKVRIQVVQALEMIASEKVGTALDNEDTAQTSNLRSKSADPDVAVSALITALKDPDATVRGYAAQALGNIRSKTAVPALTSTLQDTDARVRIQVVRALGLMGSETVATIISALQDSNTTVRAEVVRVLGGITSETAIISLISALQHTDVNVRNEVVQVLRNSPPKTLESIRSETGISSLINALNYPEITVRSYAIQALGNIRTEKVLPGLIMALKDSDISVRSSAADTLGKLHSQGVGNVPALLVRTLQNSEDLILRGVVIDNLQWYQEPSVTNALMVQLNKPSETAINRYRTINSLRYTYHLRNLAKSQVVPQTLSNLALRTEEDRFIRYGSFLLLSGINNSKAIRQLDAKKSEFLDLAETNYDVKLPFYLPDPPQKNADPDNPFDMNGGVAIAAALDLYKPSNSIFPASDIPSILQGAKPGETRESVTAFLAGKPPICRYPWLAQYWNRCRT